MKTIFRVITLLAFGALAAVTGAGLENHRALLVAQAKAAVDANTPVAVIGIGFCKKFLGITVITADGIVHGAPGAPGRYRARYRGEFAG